MRNIRIVLKKGETNVKFADPLIIAGNKLLVKSATILWDFNNLTKPTFIVHGTKTINFYNGYWTVNMIMDKLLSEKIKSELLPYSCKIRIIPKENLELNGLGPLLGYLPGTSIKKGKSLVSPNNVNVNLGMRYVKIQCDMVDGNKTSFSGSRDKTVVVLPITTQQILKGSVTHFNNINSSAELYNGIYSELNFETDKKIGEILLEFQIL